MKNIVFLALMAMTSLVKADVDFVCSFNEVIYLNQFSAEGTIFTDSEVGVDTVASSAAVTIVKKTAGNQGTQSLLDDIEAKGTSRLVTEMTSSPFLFSELKFTQDDQRYVLKVLADFPGNLSSKLLNLDSGIEFKANCKTISN